MTSDPLPHIARLTAGSGGSHDRLAQWAVWLSVGFGTAFAATVATLALWGFGGPVALVAFLGALAAFVLAVDAKVRHERWAWLWLPLCMFPAMLVFVVLGEAFWWE